MERRAPASQSERSNRTPKMLARGQAFKGKPAELGLIKPALNSQQRRMLRVTPWNSSEYVYTDTVVILELLNITIQENILASALKKLQCRQFI